MSATNQLKIAGEAVGAARKAIDTYLETTAPEKRDSGKMKELGGAFDTAMESFNLAVRTAEQRGTQSRQLSDQEKRDVSRFHWGKACRSVLKGGGYNEERLDGIEGDIVKEGAIEAREANIAFDGIMLPSWFVRRRDIVTQRQEATERERRDVTATGGTSLNQGGFTIPTEKMGVLDAFFNGLYARAAGCTILPGLTTNFDWPRIVSGTAAGVATSENANGTEVSPTFTGPSFSPKRLAAYVDISDQLTTQNSAMEAILNRNLVEQHTSKAESYGVSGSGSSGQPRGILNTTGIGSVAGGTNGALPSWTNIVKLENAIAVQNALRGTCHWLSNYKVKGQMEVTAKTSADTASTFLYDEDKNAGRLKGYQPIWTGNVPANLNKGSASAICSALIFGQFVDQVWGFWAGLNIDMVRDKTLAIAGQRCLVLNQFFDTNVVRPISFAAQQDVLTTDMN